MRSDPVISTHKQREQKNTTVTGSNRLQRAWSTYPCVCIGGVTHFLYCRFFPALCDRGTVVPRDAFEQHGALALGEARSCPAKNQRPRREQEALGGVAWSGSSLPGAVHNSGALPLVPDSEHGYFWERMPYWWGRAKP